MKRRDFFKRTGKGVLGMWAADGAASSVGNGKRFAGFLGDIEPVRAVQGEIDWSGLKKDFPPLGKLVYLDTAFNGLISRDVQRAHQKYVDEWLNFDQVPPDRTILGLWLERTERVRKKVAAFLGAEDKEIAFTLCTGCGSNIALNGISWRKGDNVVIDDLEYPTDFHILNSLKKRGVEVRIARQKQGAVPPETIDALVDSRTRAVVVTQISYVNGFRHDLKKLADIIHAREGYLIVDSAQAIGAVRVNVKEEDVDFLTGIPYKWLNGPNGVGFLYVRKQLISRFEPDRLGWASTSGFTDRDTWESRPLPDHAGRFEYGTLAFESIYGLEAALDYITGLGIDRIERHNLALAADLWNRLDRAGIRPMTPAGNQAPIVSFDVQNEAELGRKLRKMGIYVTARRHQEGQLRISPHFYNTTDDLDAFFEAYSKLTGK